MKPRIEIDENDNNIGVIHLGTVMVKRGSVERAKELVSESWKFFQETQPDCDSDYIHYLANQFPKTFAQAKGNHHVTVGGD